jgi:hypothetical protein
MRLHSIKMCLIKVVISNSLYRIELSIVNMHVKMKKGLNILGMIKDMKS